RLGRDAIAGTRTWDEHAGIALSLGPLDAREAARFFPDGDAHGQLASLAALYFGPDLDCRLSLLVSGGAPLRLVGSETALFHGLAIDGERRHGRQIGR
ncbi:type VI secretion system baseplate subunit TssG, partial [Salmonella sp. SAL04292]|uniref:type VI secretion system baseplate subunit TssG n=1 Tax=Salmonella sp. SAL04292 TaxID=3159870 RepID=UPI00397C97B5